MKLKGYFFLAAILSVLTVTAQENEEVEDVKGFKAENLFTGGSVQLSFFNGQTLLGANPMFGYALTDWADAGVVFNIVYNSAKDYPNFNDRLRQTTFGPGVFTRLYPVKFLFVQGQFERNFGKLKYIPGNGAPNYTEKATSNSLLLGVGYAQGREPRNSTFFYISLLFDVLKDVNSPYVDVVYNANTNERRVDIVPIIRAGVNVALFQKRYGRY